MSEQYQFPQEVDLSKPLSPELIGLWDQAMNKLKKRRNLALLLLIPGLLIGISLLGQVEMIYRIFTTIYSAAFLGLVGQGLVPLVLYRAGDESVPAEFHFRHSFRFKELFREQFTWPVRRMKDSFVDLNVGLVFLSAMPFMLPFFGIMSLPVFLNKLIWLSGFQQLDQQIKSPPAEEKTHSIKGTHILPSERLSGEHPNPNSPGERDADSATDDFEVLDGNLVLLPDGGLAMKGGATFDATSTFENFTMGELVLTRKDPGLLRVHFEGKDLAFFYNGSKWSKV